MRAQVPYQTEFKTHNALEKVQGDETPRSNALGKLTNGSKEIQMSKRQQKTEVSDVSGERQSTGGFSIELLISQLHM